MPDSLEAALAQAEASSFANSGKTLVIDSNLRTIRVPGGFVFGVYNDKDVLSIPFEMPRYYDDLDLSDFSIQINYVNANGTGFVYQVPEKTVLEDKITFEWLLGSGVFVKEGQVRFIVCMRLLGQEDVIEKEFNTTIATGTVLTGLEVESAEEPEQASLLARMESMVNTAAAHALEAQQAADSIGVGGTLVLGNTSLTEQQLIALLALLNS